MKKCKCGCEQTLVYKKSWEWHGIPSYISGHNARGKPMSDATRQKLSLARKGEGNPDWKGDNVGYNGLHWWIRRNYLRPQVCEDCGTTSAKLYDWANISREYKRDRSDWKRLCRRCHIRFDKKDMAHA